MGFWDILRKENKPSANKAISDAEIEFLIYSDMHDADLSTYKKSFLYDYGLDYERTIKKLSSIELIRIGNIEESISLYTVNDLKRYLTSLGMATSGKKQELIDRIIKCNRDCDNFFTKRVYVVTDKGKSIISEYQERIILNRNKKISDTISYIRSGNLKSICSMYQSEPLPNKPLDIGYSPESIHKDISAINQYISFGHDTDKVLAMCVVTLMFHVRPKTTIEILSKAGYDSISLSEIISLHTALTNLRNIAEYKDLNIEKYTIHACMDERTCQNCKEHHEKVYFVSDAVLGKTLPPFCNGCRCITHAEFKK